MTDPELRALLRDCLTLWAVSGRVDVSAGIATIETAAGRFVLTPAPSDLRPVRWLLETPERRALGRPPRAIPSVVAALSAIRNALGIAGGSMLRIGGG